MVIMDSLSLFLLRHFTLKDNVLDPFTNCNILFNKLPPKLLHATPRRIRICAYAHVVENPARDSQSIPVVEGTRRYDQYQLTRNEHSQQHSIESL